VGEPVTTLEIDPKKPLTEAEKAELHDLAARPDDDIDTSDIPPLSDEFWERAVSNSRYRPVKAKR
jgi:hypothetical protein